MAHRPGDYGLWLSYLMLFGESVRRGDREPFAVFEDDVTFANGWWEYASAAVAEAPSGWWAVYLGPHTGDPRYPPPVPVSPRLARLSHAWRTHAVVYNPWTIGELIGWAISLPRPLDQVWCEAMVRGVPHFYCTQTFLAGTRAGPSVIAGRPFPAFEGPFGLGGPVHEAASAGDLGTCPSRTASDAPANDLIVAHKTAKAGRHSPPFQQPQRSRRMRVLIRFTHGLGDAVQLTSVLRHLERHCPGWEVDVCSGVGKHTLFRGLCRRSYTPHDGSDREYDHIYDLEWYENYNRYPDCPNTKVTNCLREVFGLEPDPALLAYAVRPSDGDRSAAGRYFRSLGARELSPGRFAAVVVHHKGNTSPEKKNLECAELLQVAAEARAAGWPLVILDWDERTHPDLLAMPGVVHCTHRAAPALWRWENTGDGGRLAALIGAAGWFIGIDSGPGHVAGATGTPTTIVWTGHHPVQFYDLCENVEHLVPDNHTSLPPADEPAVLEYFTRHYRHRVYSRGTIATVLTEDSRRRFGCESDTPPPVAGAGRSCGFWVPGRADHAHQCWTIIQDVYLRDAYRTRLRPPRTGPEYVVDVGANIGAFSRLWAERNPTARIAAVEVNASLLPYLRANLRTGDHVFAAACRYASEPLYLLDSVNSEAPKSVGGSRVVGRAEWEAETDVQYGKPDAVVPSITLEEVCARAGFPRIDVLKLDCENSELDILAHCDLSRVGTVFVESHDPEAWRELLAVRFGDWDVGHHSRSGCGRFELWHLVAPTAG